MNSGVPAPGFTLAWVSGARGAKYKCADTLHPVRYRIVYHSQLLTAGSLLCPRWLTPWQKVYHAANCKTALAIH
jgi:hypothetical protein